MTGSGAASIRIFFTNCNSNLKEYEKEFIELDGPKAVKGVNKRHTWKTSREL